MAKVRNLSDIEQEIAFIEFDFYQRYEESFKTSELGRIKSLLPFREIAISFGLVEEKPKSLRTKRGRKSFFTPEGKVALAFLKMYTGLSAPKLMEALNGNIHYQIFCGIMISPENQLINYKLIDSISFIEKLSFNAFNEGTRLKHCVSLSEKLTGVPVKKIGGDQSYSGNDNRTFCKENKIETSFTQKGRTGKNEVKNATKRELARVRATAMEGSFGTQKEHYGLRKIAARIKSTEIILIFFGIHTANVVNLARRESVQVALAA